MIIADAKCPECGHIVDIAKVSIRDDFEVPLCEKCQTQMIRVFGIGAFDIAVGKTGNSATNFDNSFVKHPSTKYGQYKGTKV